MQLEVERGYPVVLKKTCEPGLAQVAAAWGHRLQRSGFICVGFMWDQNTQFTQILKYSISDQ
jgi:hypothetical protein